MKKHYLLPFLLLMGYETSAQVGINTEEPKATLDVVSRTDITLPDGIIPPRITGDLLQSKSAAYGTDQNGAVVYVTAPVTTAGPKTIGVLNTGIFVYDAMANNGSGTGIWKKIAMDPTSGVSGDGTYSLKAAGNLSLLSLGINLLGSNANYFPLTNTSTQSTT